ncbi:hypothetical protein P3S68_029609 [Capsicum galapagoense]
MIPSTFSADLPSMVLSSTFSSPSSTVEDDDFNYDVSCKLRSDHRPMSGATIIASKLLVAWHATDVAIGRNYGADVAQYPTQLMSSPTTTHPPFDSPSLIII